ncbi:uncharacterized protein LOC100875340 isoform X4 [Megachile rotundata]|uniref:uncharacterized protein LOC100875340 isoform X4 n=1 Tax=Megachile rotundata TaxID=143995 RepID=UPI003FD58FB9
MSANPMCQYFPGARNALQWGCTRSECSGGTFHPRNRSRIDGTCLLVAGLQLLRINVPAYSLRGKSALLECRYDLQGDKLYSITWYKDHEEFYRYVPRGEPTKHSYRVEGVKVDHRRSDHQQVLLQNVSLHSSGQYKCEVSAEAPSFNSVSAEAHMEVVVLPQEGPTITGEEKVYATGDVLGLNCTSGKSRPAAILKWFINGAEVKPDTEMEFELHGLYSVISSLRLELEPNHIAGDKINMRGDRGIGFELGRAARRDAHHGSLRFLRRDVLANSFERRCSWRRLKFEDQRFRSLEATRRSTRRRKLLADIRS